ncbi:MAG: FtsB family cell division protein, partial [Micrococcales bacterium]
GATRPKASKSAGRVSASRGGSKAGAKVSASLNDTREWMRTFINWDARTVTILGLFVVGVLVLAPNVQTWITFRQQIADAQAAVNKAKQSVTDMTAERKRWDDPVYVRAQARQRLYYVLPGEVSYLVMDAGSVNTSDTSGTVGSLLADSRNTTQISNKVTSTSDNWVDLIGGSVIQAGTTQPADKTNAKN